MKQRSPARREASTDHWANLSALYMRQSTDSPLRRRQRSPHKGELRTRRGREEKRNGILIHLKEAGHVTFPIGWRSSDSLIDERMPTGSRQSWRRHESEQNHWLNFWRVLLFVSENSEKDVVNSVHKPCCFRCFFI
jgi:hypothetical protein